MKERVKWGASTDLLRFMCVRIPDFALVLTGFPALQSSGVHVERQGQLPL